MKGKNSKSLFTIIFLVIVCLCFTSCSDYKCTQGDCKNGFGTAVFTNGGKYVGEWKDGKQHGQGTVTKADGSQYSGEFKEGKMLPKGSA